jgi:SAM-dependent methyltransferase
MSRRFCDHFSGVAGASAEFRPRYPDALFDWLADLAPRRELAWDCATGSGQAAAAQARLFERDVETDASTEKLEAATPHPRVEYRVAPAEESGLGADSADAITVAQALHWFDRPAFYGEAERVLRVGGVLAVWTYGHPHLDPPETDALFQEFYSGTVGPYWPPERALVDAGYRTIEFPFPEVDPPPFEMDTHWTLAALLGYVATWSATTRFRSARGFDPVPALGEALARAWGNPEEARRIRWPLAVRAGRRGR